jgi:ATP-binding cassette subfamily F protein uup
VIADYEGTVLLVSHYRDFLDRTVTITLGLDGSGKVDIVAGGYDDWDRRRSAVPCPSGGGGAERRRGNTAKAPSVSIADSTPSGGAARNKLTYKDQRDLDRLPGEIERIEREMANAEASLADPDLYARDPHRFAELTKTLDTLRSDKHAAEERWLEVAAMAEELAR